VVKKVTPPDFLQLVKFSGGLFNHKLKKVKQININHNLKNENMENLLKFVICDKTENSGRPYISEDLSNTGDINSAWQFETKEAAEKVITDSNWEWAFVEEK